MRVIVIIIAISWCTFTFYRTELGSRSGQRTAIAFVVFIGLGCGLYYVSHEIQKIFSDSVTTNSQQQQPTGRPATPYPEAAPSPKGILDANVMVGASSMPLNMAKADVMVDMDSLKSYAGDYLVMVVFRADDHSIDVMHDPSIFKSNTFSITSGKQMITTYFSQDFIRHYRLLPANTQVQAFGTIIPQTVVPRNIFTLSELVVQGGKIGNWIGLLQVTVTKMSTKQVRDLYKAAENGGLSVELGRGIAGGVEDSTQRHLTPVQMVQITKSMSKFKGQRLLLKIEVGNDEEQNYGGDFWQALYNAGWKVSMDYPSTSDEPCGGVVIMLPLQLGGHSISLTADALEKELIELGIAVNRGQEDIMPPLQMIMEGGSAPISLRVCRRT